jgi:hypothetical protein
MVDAIAKDGAKNELYCPSNAPLVADEISHFVRMAKPMGRYAFLIYSCVQLHPWCHGLEVAHPFITVVSRLNANHN